MKDYIKKQYSGNENGWKEPVKELSIHRMHEEQAEELNSHFRNTGTKYEEVAEEAKAEEAEQQEQSNEEAAPAKPKRVRPSRAKAKA